MLKSFKLNSLEYKKSTYTAIAVVLAIIAIAVAIAKRRKSKPKTVQVNEVYTTESYDPISGTVVKFDPDKIAMAVRDIGITYNIATYDCYGSDGRSSAEALLGEILALNYDKLAMLHNHFSSKYSQDFSGWFSKPMSLYEVLKSEGCGWTGCFGCGTHTEVLQMLEDYNLT
jgi:hypothetical protein